MPGAYWNPALLAFRKNIAYSLHAEKRDLDRAGGSLGIEGNSSRKTIFLSSIEFFNNCESRLNASNQVFGIGQSSYPASRSDIAKLNNWSLVLPLANPVC